jgi:hypothetical protein
MCAIKRKECYNVKIKEVVDRTIEKGLNLNFGNITAVEI